MNLHNKEKKEIETSKSFKAQKIVLYWLLGLIYLSFIGLQLGGIQAIADFNYNLHEMMYLPFNIAIFIAPVLFLIYIILFIKDLRKRRRQKRNFKTIVKSTLVVISVVIIFSITEYQRHKVSTGGIFEVKQKIHEDRKYYLLINDKKIRVSYNEFQLVEEKQQYLISFIWNERSPDKGRIETIEPLD